MTGLSNPDKVLWPEAGITKADLASYYDTIADRLLPHLRGRPVTLSHRPRGVEHRGFIRKDLPDHAPATVGRWRTWAHTARREVTYALIENREALAWCASQNVVEFHPCLFRVDRPDRLDVVVIDLDPAADSVSAAVAAGWVKKALDDLQVASWCKTSGGRGLHILVPVERRYTVDELRHVADRVSSTVVERHPRHLTTEFRVEDRGGRLFIDCTRVGIGATLISAWSPRARSTPTVATPLDWAEVTEGLDPAGFTQSVAVDRTETATTEGQRVDHVLR